MDAGRLSRGSRVEAPTVSASMATAALLYSGITVKMLVDKRLDAQLHTMFMVGYQPGAVAHPHDHPFEESYLMLEGEVDVVADGDRYTLRPGDVFWTGVGCIHAFYETKGGTVKWLETSAPGPPDRHSYRFERDWEYLAERLRDGAVTLPGRKASAERARPRALPRPLPADAPDPRLRGSDPVALPARRGLRNDAPLLGPGGGRRRLRERARGARPGGRDLSRARSCARARRRSAGAARRDARPRDRDQRRARRLDERHLAEGPPDRLLRDRRRQHRRGDRRRRSRCAGRAESRSRTSATAR